MNVFFISELTNGAGWLSPDETRHALKVLRVRTGDKVLGTDGKGLWIEGEFEIAGKDRACIRIQKKEYAFGEHEFSIHLAVSPLRLPDRFEWMLEKAVELGVTKVTPLITERTVKHGFRSDRMEKIMISAIKQCMRSRLPELDDPQDLSKFIHSESSSAKFFGFAGSIDKPAAQTQLVMNSETICLVIGPEGDFTDAEVGDMKNAGFLGLDFGENRLRSETAAIFGLSWLKAVKGW